jgi:hypothetical protein
MDLRVNSRSAWLVLLLAPLQAMALGGDPNLLVKPKNPKPTEGYVLFSMLYLKSALRPGETPCMKVELTPVVTEGVKKPRSQWLSTATGMHCNTAWKDTEAVAEEDGVARVVILAALPTGEYEISTGSVQYSDAQYTVKSDPGVVGFGRVQIAAGRLAYAGAFRLLQSPGRTLIAAADLWTKDSEVLKKLRPDLDTGGVIMAKWADPSAK